MAATSKQTTPDPWARKKYHLVVHPTEAGDETAINNYFLAAQHVVNATATEQLKFRFTTVNGKLTLLTRYSSEVVKACIAGIIASAKEKLPEFQVTLLGVIDEGVIGGLGTIAVH